MGRSTRRFQIQKISVCELSRSSFSTLDPASPSTTLIESPAIPSLQEATAHAVVGLQMADRRFHGTAAFSPLFLSSCQTMSAAASQMNGGSALIAMTTVSFVDGGIRDGNAGNPLGRGNRFGGLPSHTLMPTIQLQRLVVVTETF